MNLREKKAPACGEEEEKSLEEIWRGGKPEVAGDPKESTAAASYAATRARAESVRVAGEKKTG